MFVFDSDGRRSCDSCGSVVVEPGSTGFEEFDDTSDALVDGVPTAANTAPSGWMAFELDHSTGVPAQLSPTELVDGAIGFERLASWAMARQQELISEFHHRPDNGTARASTTSDAESGSEVVREWAGDEIALALTLAPSMGAVRVAAADRLAGVLRPTRDLLETGRISQDRARLITDMLWGYDDQIADAVQQRVLPRAPGMTWGQLRAALTRAILAVVPDGQQRHRRARRERRVDVYPGQEGMATLSAFLTAAEATSSFEWVTRLARGVQPAPATDGTAGSGRGRGSMDRRRADVLVALLTGRLVATTADTAGTGATTTVAECAPAGPAPTDAGTMRTAPAETAPGNAAPAAAAPPDTAPTDTAPTDTARTDTARTDTAPATPTTAAPTEEMDADPPGAPSSGALSSGALSSGAVGPVNGTGEAGLLGGAGGPGPVGGAGVLAAPVSAHRPLIHITIPLSTLLGLDDEPADLAGYGPLPADVARDIALDPNSTWRRLLTDPVTGQLLDYGRTTYRPPAGLAGFVRTRDGTCRHPGCRRPAIACELDHVQPWAQCGSTSEDNICALCERHHDLKEQQGWQVVLHDDRSLEWITPTGHRYSSRPVENPVPPRPDPNAQPDPTAQPDPRAQPEPDQDRPARADPEARTRAHGDPFARTRPMAPPDGDDPPPF